MYGLFFCLFQEHVAKDQRRHQAHWAPRGATSHLQTVGLGSTTRRRWAPLGATSHKIDPHRWSLHGISQVDGTIPMDPIYIKDFGAGVSRCVLTARQAETFLKYKEEFCCG